MQEKYYPNKLPECSGMGKRLHDHLAEGLAAFTGAARVLMRLRKIESDSELAALVDNKSRKTVNNAMAGRHDAQISTLEAISEALDCPLWVMFLVGNNEADLQSPRRERLIAMVEAYLQCDDESRHHVESMAAAFCAKSKKASAG